MLLRTLGPKISHFFTNIDKNLVDTLVDKLGDPNVPIRSYHPGCLVPQGQDPEDREVLRDHRDDHEEPYRLPGGVQPQAPEGTGRLTLLGMTPSDSSTTPHPVQPTSYNKKLRCGGGLFIY
jgi:hypothetical protein